MASGSASHEYHSSVGTSADTVTLTSVFRAVQVFNRGTQNLYVTTGTDAKTPTAAVAAAADTHVIPANSSRIVAVDGPVFSASNTTNPTETLVSVIADAAGPCNYSVVGN